MKYYNALSISTLTQNALRRLPRFLSDRLQDVLRARGSLVKDLDAVIGKTGLTISWIDKNLCILGLTVDAVARLWDTFVSVDDALILILQKKKEVTKALKDAGVDLSEVWIEKMEEEPELAFNPPPYLISA